MSDLIRREDAIDATWKNPSYSDALNALAEVRERIRAIPSAEALHGEWIWCGDRGDSRFMCSICKSKENVPTIMGEPTVWDYCPYCGARMTQYKGGEDE